MSFPGSHCDPRSLFLAHSCGHTFCIGFGTLPLQQHRKPLRYKRSLAAVLSRASGQNNGVSKSAPETIEASKSSDSRVDVGRIATLAQSVRSSQQQDSPASSPDGGSPRMATLMVKCPDRKGVIASLATLLYGLGCNILASEQFTAEEGVYFQRIRFDLSDLLVGTPNTRVLEQAISGVADKFGMEWKLFYDNQVKRVAILVSRMDHCLYDLLIRHRAGELKCEIPVVISNHPDLENIASSFGVPFKYFPLPSGSGPDAKRAQEAKIEALLAEENVDLIVLARYMQIFSPEFCSRHATHTINIHHSFLPAFEGAKPYHRAYERGVKVIGATAHYATSELDAGPIIEQDVTRISHRDSVQDMIRKGRDLERLVLSRALRSVLSDCVMVYGNRTVVFDA